MVIGYLIYTGLRDTMIFYLTVSEVMAQPLELSQTQKVGGFVNSDSVRWDPKTLKLSFELEDQQSRLIVSYSGVVPDSFKPGAEVIVEGTYRGNGSFQATTIMPKCASKYE
jgi:cytochrome c-type biogenesis protein CcmE